MRLSWASYDIQKRSYDPLNFAIVGCVNWIIIGFWSVARVCNVRLYTGFVMDGHNYDIPNSHVLMGTVHSLYRLNKVVLFVRISLIKTYQKNTNSPYIYQNATNDLQNIDLFNVATSINSKHTKKTHNKLEKSSNEPSRDISWHSMRNVICYVD